MLPHPTATAPPLLLLLKGHPGCGKSTLARRLAAALQWPLVDKDDARDAFGPLEQAGLGRLVLNAVAYDVMWRCCGRQLDAGLPGVLVDCPLARPELFLRAAELAAQHGAQVAVVECRPGDQEAWRARLEARAAMEGGGPQAHKPQSWPELQALVAGYAGADEWPTSQAGSRPPHLLRLDTTAETAEQCAARVLAWLQQQRLLRGGTAG